MTIGLKGIYDYDFQKCIQMYITDTGKCVRVIKGIFLKV
jgi:hypothetical protein